MTEEKTPPPASAEDEALLRDLVLADRDLLALAADHGLSLAELAEWSDRPGRSEAIVRLCRLADLQCQALLSRYRLIAASRLIAQAGNEDGTLSAEQVRKACVDLLKTNPADLKPDPATEIDEETDPALALLQQAIAQTEP
ncbi:MAG: hypothetical protein AAGC44_01990 [Planctomycetota bacterium]